MRHMYVQCWIGMMSFSLDYQTYVYIFLVYDYIIINSEELLDKSLDIILKKNKLEDSSKIFNYG